jgi:cation:H+ antiporter
VVGSNIFNVFLCLGGAAIAGAVGAPLASVKLDVLALVAMTVLAAVFIRTERTMTRLEGGLVLLAYGAFMVITIARG